VKRVVGYLVRTESTKMITLPERINAMKCISYDVESIVDAMMTMDYRESEQEITLEDVLEWIGWANGAVDTGVVDDDVEWPELGGAGKERGYAGGIGDVAR